MTVKLVWEGFELGGEYDATKKLRVLSRPGKPGVTGLGVSKPDVAVTSRLAGGAHYGVPRVPHRIVQVPALQCRAWPVAQAFVASMQASRDPLPLQIEGGPYGSPVVLFAHPQGAQASWDVLATNDSNDVIHVEGSEWVAPDPTFYDAAPTVQSGTGTAAGFTPLVWTNPGDLLPEHGVGGSAWEMAIDVSGTSNGSPIATILTVIASDYDTDTSTWVEAPWTRIVGSFYDGDRIIIGADRVPVRVASSEMPPQVETRYGSSWRPQPLWPRFTPGVQSRIGVSPDGSATVDYEVSFRGTWL